MGWSVAEHWRQPVLIFLRGATRPDSPPIVCRLDLDSSVWTVSIAFGEVEVRSGEPVTADISLRTDPKTLGSLLADPASLDAALADGSVAFVGDRQALNRLLYGG